MAQSRKGCLWSGECRREGSDERCGQKRRSEATGGTQKSPLLQRTFSIDIYPNVAQWEGKCDGSEGVGKAVIKLKESELKLP